MNASSQDQRDISRRRMLQRVAGVAAVGTLGVAGSEAVAAQDTPRTAITKGRIRQSMVYWCFREHWDFEKACQVAKQLGMESIELVPPKDWPVLKRHGLKCAIASSHSFTRGFNNPKYHAECFEKLYKSIDACAEFGVPSVITFTGFSEGIPSDVGARNCVQAYKKVAQYAEKKKVTVCLEMLNSRVNVTMKGHPGYQGDHTDYCIDILKRVGSPRVKLLFDIYHVQIMDGDVIVRIRDYKDLIGHYHTAGNPGRRELDDKQEINYKPIMEEIVKTGYKGFVGQEFIPTRDPLEGLREAVVLCDV